MNYQNPTESETNRTKPLSLSDVSLEVFSFHDRDYRIYIYIYSVMLLCVYGFRNVCVCARLCVYDVPRYLVIRFSKCDHKFYDTITKAKR